MLPGRRLPGRDRLGAGRLSRPVTAAATPGAPRWRDTVWPIFFGLSVLLHLWLFLFSRPVFPELAARPAGAATAGRIVVADLVPKDAPRPPPGASAAALAPPESAHAATAGALASPPAASASASQTAAQASRPAFATPPLKAGSMLASATPNLPQTSQADGTADPALYHSAHSLSRQPELVGEAPESLEIPSGLRSGHLLARLSIDRFGKVNAVSVLRSTLPHEVEGQIAMQFYQASYRPGEIDGKPVNAEMTLFINLEPN
ncbi:MAG: hypothetical protein JWR22_3943 [Herminiimonas sp.]|nr:hypothetical protein [Herminiimonas sp.]